MNTRFFDEIDSFRRSVERLLENGSWGHSNDAYPRPFVPMVETGWTDDYLNMRFVLPAVSQEDLDFSIQGNQLILRGKRRLPSEFGKQEQTFYRLPYGEFERTVDLPNGLNLDLMEARLHHGVLDVRVPVAESMKPKRIEIASDEPSAILAA
jgi:HSP20 family protein